VSDTGELLAVERDNVSYAADERYPDALHFDPAVLWDQIMKLTGTVLKATAGIPVRAITASSQREGIVVLDGTGTAVIGLPNHDHRGREWESLVADKHRVYALTGRYPGSLFSALKMVALRERYPEWEGRLVTFTSISDWAQYQLSGVLGYEYAQASETLLCDVEKGCWSEELCRLFSIDRGSLPPLRCSGEILGPLQARYARKWGLPADVPVLVGGADTQLAIKSTRPLPGDIVIVSGTTTPVVKITDRYLLDEKERTWTNRHVEKGRFILETNCGVTGLNFQRMKEIFYRGEAHEVIEKELDAAEAGSCLASLGSLVAGEKTPLTTGGFIFSAPVSHLLTRADFVRAILWDMACCVRENYDALVDGRPYDRDYVWACGGGMQSSHFGKFVAGLLGRKIRIRPGFQQASVSGGAVVCREAMGGGGKASAQVREILPEDQEAYAAMYEKWKRARASFRRTAAEAQDVQTRQDLS
jgi:autoinducer 2 (AI-2) kinase